VNENIPSRLSWVFFQVAKCLDKECGQESSIQSRLASVNQFNDHMSVHPMHKDEDGVHLFKDISLPLLVDDFGPFPVVLPSAFGILVWGCHSQIVWPGGGNSTPLLVGLGPLHKRILYEKV
jgi:hypothetical protein